MTAPTYPDFNLTSLGVVRMKDGKLAVTWKATTNHEGQQYSLMGPLKASVLLTTAGYVNDADGAREIMERRLPAAIERQRVAR